MARITISIKNAGELERRLSLLAGSVSTFALSASATYLNECEKLIDKIHALSALRERFEHMNYQKIDEAFWRKASNE